MEPPSKHTFGLLIAYVIPGTIVIWGLQGLSDTAAWLISTNNSELGQPTVGGFLHITLAAIGIGMTISALRWLVIDTIHHRTGIRPPDPDFKALKPAVGAFALLVEFHYRYYQFYANSFIALVIAYPAYRLTPADDPGSLLTDFIAALTAIVYFLASRDTLKKYYERMHELLDS